MFSKNMDFSASVYSQSVTNCLSPWTFVILLVSEESTVVCLSLSGPLSITLSPNSVDLKLLLIL